MRFHALTKITQLVHDFLIQICPLPPFPCILHLCDPKPAYGICLFIPQQLFSYPRWMPAFLPSCHPHHLLSRCSDNLELLLSESQGLAQLWQHREQCQLPWFSWKNRRSTGCSQRPLASSQHPLLFYIPSLRTSNPLSLHPFPIHTCHWQTLWLVQRH